MVWIWKEIVANQYVRFPFIYLSNLDLCVGVLVCACCDACVEIQRTDVGVGLLVYTGGHIRLASTRATGLSCLLTGIFLEYDGVGVGRALQIYCIWFYKVLGIQTRGPYRYTRQVL